MDSSDLVFHDFLPAMAEKLGAEGLFQELAKGFELLADPLTHTITVSSLRQNAGALGLASMSDEDFFEMIRLGDCTGHGELDLHQFCVAMVRSSPDLMQEALMVLLDEDEDCAMEEDEESNNDTDEKDEDQQFR